MENEFLKNPVHLNILGIDQNYKIYLKQLLVYIGNVPTEVLNELNKLNVNNPTLVLNSNVKSKVLENYYGNDWKSVLGFDSRYFKQSSESKQGGFNVKQSSDVEQISNVKQGGDIKLGSQENDIFDLTEDVIDTEKITEKQADKIKKEIEKTIKEEAKGKKQKPEKELEPVESDNLIKDVKKEKLETKIKKPVKSEYNKIVFINNVKVYPEDRISEFKEKIYLSTLINNNVITELNLYKQHLYSIINDTNNEKENDQVITIKYKFMVDSNINIDIRKLFNYKNSSKILNIPVDTMLYQNKDLIQVESMEYFTTLLDLYQSFNVRKYYVISVDEFIDPEKNLIKELSTNDQYQFQLLYYGFIIKYWPIMTLDVFTLFINNEGDIKNSYPDLALSQNALIKKYNEESRILDYKYNLLTEYANKKTSSKDFEKYNPEFSIFSDKNIKKESIIGVAIKTATLSNITTHTEDISSQIKINIRNLFSLLEASADIPLIKAKLLVDGRIITLTKIKSPNVVENEKDDIQKIYEKIKYRLQMPYYNTILIAIKIKNISIGNSVGISTDMDSNYLIFTIYDNGKYNIKSLWDEEIQMDFRKIYEIINENVSPVIETINNYGRTVFESVRRLSLIKRNATEFSSLNMSMFWKIPITRLAFTKIYELIKQDMQSNIIKPIDSSIEKPNADTNSYSYYIIKGITEYDLNQLYRTLNTNNYYEYLSNARVKQKWNSIVEKGRNVEITHRTSDIKIEIQGLKEKEFTNFYQYIISFLYRVEKEILSKKESIEKIQKLDVSDSNINKLLKSRDPELYIFKRFGSNIVYSRICQKGKQPIPYLPDEYDLLDNKIKQKAVKYWNFTTKSPMYYVCPNKKYPYLNFLVGNHPKGYCLPCCKITPPYEYELNGNVKKSNNTGSSKNDQSEKAEDQDEENELEKTTKKEHIYNICMQHHVYTEQDTQSAQSRYIMNYGKPVDIGRIGKLPDIIDRYLLYNLEDKEIIETSNQTITRDFGNGEKVYAVNLLWKITKNNKIFEEPVNKYKGFLESKSWSGQTEQFNAIEIIDNPGLSPEHFNRISNADLSYPIIVYDDVKNNIFQVLDGVHRIAKILLEAKNNKTPLDDLNIKVRYITRKQILKAIITDNSESSNSESKSDKKTGSNEHFGSDFDSSELFPSDKSEGKSLVNITGGNVTILKEFKTGGGIKKPGYYLYGVPQNNVNISNIGAGFSIASALNITFEEFIQKSINVFKINATTNYFKILLKGKLMQFFNDLDHLILVMSKLFIDQKLTLTENEYSIFKNTTRFYLWNELFIDIAKICFNKYVIVLDDASTDTTGTSIKNVNVTENINIILPDKVNHVDDIIPHCDKLNLVCETANQKFSTEFILLLRRKKKSKSFFSINKLYYPIFIFVPQIFFKTMNIEKKIFTYKDEIMKLIRNILLNSLTEQSITGNQQTINLDIDLKTIILFLNYLKINKMQCFIDKIYSNSKNMCYALLVNINNDLVYFSIKHSYYENIPNEYFADSTDLKKYVLYEPFVRKKSNICDFKSLKNILEYYNTFVIEESENKGFYKSVEVNKNISKLNQRENRIIPVYPLLKVQNVLVVFNKNKNSKIIGIQSNNMFYYFQDLDLTKENLSKVYKYFTNDYNIFGKNFEFSLMATCIKYLYYDPDMVNELIYKNISKIEKKDTVTEYNKKHLDYYKAVYSRYLYNLFLLEFMSYIDTDRNEKLRNDLFLNILKTNFKDNSAYEKIKSYINEKLANFPDDINKIQEQINLYLTTHYDKKILLQELKNLVYQFDRTTLLKLEDISDSYFKNDIATRKQQHTDLYNYIEKIIKNIIIIGEPVFNENTHVSNIFVPCNSSSEIINNSKDISYCSSGKNRKLLVPKNKIDNIINMFIDDIVNPIKRKYLLSSILISNIQNYFQFEKRTNEEIFVKFD